MADVDTVLNDISNLVNAVRGAISDLIDRISGTLRDIIDFISGGIDGLIGAIVDTFDDMFTAVFTSIRSLFDRIVERISSIVETVVNTIKTFIADSIQFVVDIVDRALEIINSVFDKVANAIDAIVQDVSSRFIEFFNAVKEKLQEIIDTVKLFFQDIFDTVRDGVRSLLDSARTVMDVIVQGIKDFIDSVVNTVGGALRELLEMISELPGELAELAEKLFESAKEHIMGPIEGLPLNTINNIVEVVTGQALDDAQRLELESMSMLFGRSPVAQTPSELRQIIQKMMPENPVMKTIVMAFVSPLIIMNVMSGIAHANGQIVLQEHALTNPYRVLDPLDAVKSEHYGLSDRATVTNYIRRAGYDEAQTEVLIGLGKQPVPMGELLSWWLRGIIDESTLAEQLKRHGVTDADINRLQTAAFFIPPVQDLITMSVRDVFSPQIAERFGQFEDFPSDFEREAKKQGISKEWAERYWASHWRLPSVLMGFEMLHRRVIDEETLNLLLKASDVMPFWRDKLTAISYSPLTRVDVRRMHKLGVLTLDEVKTSYQDIGYNEVNAQRLTDFTEQYNKAPEEDESTELADLTRSNIIRFFKDGVFTASEAIDVFIAAGTSREAAELFIFSAQLEIEAELRADAIDLVIERVKGGLITLSQAEDELSRLDLQELEKQKAVNDLQREEAKRNKLPSKSDLDKFYKQGVITEAEYLTNIQLLGYSLQWAQRYLQLAKGGIRDSSE